jgi:hypothetical protein
MGTLILLALGFFLLTVVVEAVGVQLLTSFTRYCSKAVGDEKPTFHLSTLIILNICVAFFLYLSISSKNGEYQYAGWPLPSKTLVKSYNLLGRLLKSPPSMQWNWLNIVLNVIFIFLVLFLIWFFLDRRKRAKN